MKNLKFVFLSCFFSLFFSLPVFAADSDVLMPTVDRFREQLGLSQEEFDSSFNEDGVAIFDSPQTFTTSTIDEDISLQSGGIQISYINDDGQQSGGFIPFGSTYSLRNNPKMLQMLLYNDDSVLFTKPGSLTLNCILYGFRVTCVITYADGSTESRVIDNDMTVTVNPVVIDNPGGDIVKIQFNLTNPVFQSGENILACGIQSYSYEEYGADNIFQLLGRFIGSFFKNLTDSFGDIDNADIGSDALLDLENAENQLVDKSGNVSDIVFEDSVFTDSTLTTVAFIAEMLQIFYASTRFGALFNLTVTLLMAAILLGFARHWKGGSK